MNREELTLKVGFIFSNKNKNLFFYMSEFLKNVWTNDELSFVCFSLSDINLNLMTVAATTINKNGIFEKQEDVPKLIFNFVCHTKAESIKTMRQLRTTDGYKVINPINRFNQAVIFDIVKSFPQSEQFLLPFCALNKGKIMEQLDKSDDLYILPERGLSSQNTICVHSLDNEKLEVSIGTNSSYIDVSDLFDTLIKMTMGKKYMSVQGTKILRRNNLPMEARIYAQKNQNGIWQITNSISKHDIFSNGSIYNGKSEDLRFALFEERAEAADEILARLFNIAITLCSFLEYYVIDMCSLIFDYIIGDDGEVYLIYFSGCEQDFSKMDKEYEREFYYNIIRYMLFLGKELIYFISCEQNFSQMDKDYGLEFYYNIIKYMLSWEKD